MDGHPDADHTTVISLTPIGHVERNVGDDELSHDELRARPARILLDPTLADGLMGLEPGSHIVVLYYLHRSSGYELHIHPQGDPDRPLRGVFATRSPCRPNPIGVTTVRVQHIAGNVLEVIGLDALAGSPVLDIKIHARSFDVPPASNFPTSRPTGRSGTDGELPPSR